MSTVNENTENTENTDKSTPEEVALAGAQGWVDQENYKGTAWKSAHQFLSDGQKHTAALTARNEKLAEQVKDLQSTMAQLVDDQVVQKEKAVKKAITALKLQKVEAINESDGETAVKIDEEIDRLKQAAKPPANGAFDRWVVDNPWYRDDPELKMEADFYANLYSGSNQTPEKVFAAVTRRIKREFPDYFKNPNKAEPASMSAAAHSQSSSVNGRSFNDLPSEAKAACDRFIKVIPKFTREKYLASYEWDE